MTNDNSISKYIKIPDIISLGNGIMGLLSIISSINQQQLLAMSFIALAGIFDFLDGRVARHLGIASEFGKQLDSFCDLCSFILAPIVFLYSIESIDSNLRLIVSILYTVAGILRLARFNITGTINHGKHFEGMPVPFSILIIGAYFIFQFLGLSLFIWIALFLLHAVFMVSTIKIKKF